MSQDASELVVASKGAVYVAPVGTTLPTDIDTNLDPAFVELGLITEDGATISATPDIFEAMAWQSRQAVRRELNAQEVSAAFALEQWNADSVPLAFGGGTVTEPSPGVFRYDFPQEGDSLDERSLVIDAEDGDRKLRFVFPRGNVTESVESQFQRSALAVLPITFKALEPTTGGAAAYFLTNDDAFDSGS